MSILRIMSMLQKYSTYNIINEQHRELVITKERYTEYSKSKYVNICYIQKIVSVL